MAKMNDKSIEELFNSETNNPNVKEAEKIINKLRRTLNPGLLKELRKVIYELKKENFDKENIDTIEKEYMTLENEVYSKYSKKLGKVIKNLRTKKGLSLAELEDISGVSSSYINRFEKGDRRSPTILVLNKIANGLEVPLNLLIKESGFDLGEESNGSIQSLIMKNKISLRNMGPIMNQYEKEKLINIIDLIANADWENNNEVSFKILKELIDEFH